MENRIQVVIEACGEGIADLPYFVDNWIVHDLGSNNSSGVQMMVSKSLAGTHRFNERSNRRICHVPTVPGHEERDSMHGGNGDVQRFSRSLRW